MEDAEFHEMIDDMPGSLGMILRVTRHYIRQGIKLPDVIRVDRETYDQILLDIKVWNTMSLHPEMESTAWPCTPDGAPLVFGSTRLEPVEMAEVAEKIKNPDEGAQQDAFIQADDIDPMEAVMVRRRKSFDEPRNN